MKPDEEGHHEPPHLDLCYLQIQQFSFSLLFKCLTSLCVKLASLDITNCCKIFSFHFHLNLDDK